MNVRIVTFPETKIASIAHTGSPHDEHATVRRLVTWKLENRLLDPARHRHYGLHYARPQASPAGPYRVAFCLSIEDDLGPNAYGIVQSTIPSMRCACARDIGSRLNNQAAAYLCDEWLPGSGEKPLESPLGDLLIFHYVNVGPDIPEHEAITDVYLPLA